MSQVEKVQVTIGICGLSGAGKSFLLQTLEQRNSVNYCAISLDNYYRGHDELLRDENGYINFDVPDALDHTLFLTHLVSLKNGSGFQHTVYPFETGLKRELPLYISPKPALVAEGIFLFAYPHIRTHFDIAIFIETDLELCLQRRLERDIRERGISKSKSLYQWHNHVLPAYYQHIQPHSQNAHLVVNGEDDAQLNAVKIEAMISDYFS